MDERLIAWARATRSRHRRDAARLAPLWLFTDPVRTPDPAAAARALPKGLCGIVFRPDAVAGVSQTARALLQVCRQRRLSLSIAGPVPLPAGAGSHARRGRRLLAHAWPRTASAHGAPELLRARGLGVRAVFLSPYAPTASHPGQPALGPIRWAALAARAGRSGVLPLGGVTGRTARRLPRWVRGAGAIGALLPEGSVAAAPQCPAIAAPRRS